jgi:hypothetical protein
MLRVTCSLSDASGDYAGNRKPPIRESDARQCQKRRLHCFRWQGLRYARGQIAVAAASSLPASIFIE